MSDYPVTLQALVAVARRAGECIMKHYGDEVAVRYKADESPVTAADLAAHQSILDELIALTPGVPRLSEEAAAVPWAQRQAWTRYWLIDPLDGTREFIARNGEFTVNIALIEHGEPVMGVVHAPDLDETYYAARGQGAWMATRRGSPAPMLLAAAKVATPRVLVTRSHATEALTALLNGLPAHEAVRVGSALKFGRLAAGEGEFYPRVGPTSEWDTAAGHCVVAEAGGRVLAAGGQRLRYNQTPSLLNPDFSVAAPPCFAWQDTLP
ncbi:3'(2'),5'-bisphosphate nucleotidase CysQ [Abyssibacter sp.]|jgi:3'(2'), 5'-bisphosphate nucleotidase|uniref:3'(2'),5'-bisphosphate nucleotidase CysQ n=1 Tax=Abyssibacter sp. TaxID=2320200 RepID=UPI000C458E48|nr:3'(2'),5'-bisphosphate nucleotidase CysQ [Abyssibacter sp.]MBB88149.1 3'(2'),5'-bisphosphate nucleotidase [Xanthomonadales bacterium]MCK5859457.1 3'(2'),5'-bisphosphate nucleotidase CysQ [Abyssibacter sp.]